MMAENNDFEVFQLSFTVTKCLNNHLERRKGLLWFTVFKVSVHDLFAPLLWAQLVRQYLIVEVGVGEAAPLMAARKQRRTERSHGPVSSSKAWSR